MARGGTSSASRAPAREGAASATGEWCARCDSCGASYALAAWLRLPVVANVEPAWLASHVMAWPADEVIEVRRCGRCRTAMSRRRPLTADS